ncbi:MAG: T9SS type A sorting domain-containing protein [bacterium]
MKKITLLFLYFTLPFVMWAQYGIIYEMGPDLHYNRMNQLHIINEDHSIVLMGGHGTDFISLNSCEIYLPDSNPVPVLTMNATHDYASIVKLEQDKYLLIGGSADLGVAPGNNVAEIYDAYNRTFTLVPAAMNYGRMFLGSTLLTNENVLIVGGWYDKASATYGEVYNPTTHTFTVTGELNSPRSGPKMVSTTDGKATIFGGTDIYGNTFYQNVEEYDPITNQFTVVSEYFFPDEPNWQIGYKPKLNTDHKMFNGKYLYIIYNSDSLSYRLMTFDPENKIFEKYYTNSPLTFPMNSSVHDLVIGPSGEYGQIIYSYEKDGNTYIGVYVLFLYDNRLDTWGNVYELPFSYSINSASIDAIFDEYICICGGSTGTGNNYNFIPVNKTIKITFLGGDVKELSGEIPTEYSLAQNYPNPFNPSTKIRFSLNTSGNVSLKIYDILGKEITTLVNKYMDAGNYEADFNVSETGKNLSSGVYIYQLKLKDKILSNKMMILE